MQSRVSTENSIEKNFPRKAFMHPQADYNVAGSVLKYGVCGLIFRDGMRKDDWIKLYVPFIIGLLVGGGAGYTNINMTAYFIITPIILSVLMFVCIRYFSEPEIDERLEFEKRNRKRDEAKEKNQIFVEFLQYLNEDYINELIVAYGGSQPYGVTRLMSLISKKYTERYSFNIYR